jgi:hypothetical protein
MNPEIWIRVEAITLTALGTSIVH